ncbi:pancreatic secretory granule membrane major glycoprotein GP2-like [Xenopus tropicalis]|uniref:Pancreatic secretory granule membrane major glycoprotein GP2-like n=1 Tax=Xenopus tropicalis TaxID=8364 RepID=A0A8J1J6D3_XENTR|nr:pancreatic secretory granule membrane major glycoprotein GP2-like [Xenopus tropicalis]
MNFLYVLGLTTLLVERGVAQSCYAGTDPPPCNTCGGVCSFGNPCQCSTDQRECMATTAADCDAADNTCCLTGYYWSSALSCCTTTPACYPACQSDEVCATVNNTATCTCNSASYTGLTSSSLSPTVKCNSGTMVVSLSKCLMAFLGYDSLHLSNNTDPCTNTYTEVINGKTMNSIQALTQSNWCGNMLMIDATKVSYTNILVIGSLNIYKVSFTCSYNLSMQINLDSALHAVMSSVNLTVNGQGSVTTTMTAYWDQAYSKPILSNDEVTTGSDIFLGVTSGAADGNTFVLRVETCAATPDGDLNNVNKIMIVEGGCPANEGVFAEVQENGQSLEARIKISSFAFQGQPLVYVTCQVLLCDKSGVCTGCTQSRQASRSEGTLEVALNFQDKYYTDSSASQSAMCWSVLAGSLLVLLKLY